MKSSIQLPDERNNQEWKKKLSEIISEHGEKANFSILLPTRFFIYDAECDGSHFHLNVKINGRKTSIRYHYESDSGAIVDPVTLYSGLVILVLNTFNARHLLLGACDQTNSRLLVSFVKSDGMNKIQTKLCVNNKIDKLILEKWCNLLGLVCFDSEKKVLINSPGISRAYLQNLYNSEKKSLTIDFNQSIASFFKALEKENLSCLIGYPKDYYNPIEAQLNLVMQLLHDGKKSPAPTLTKDILTVLFKGLDPHKQIIFLDELFIYIQKNAAEKYSHEKPFFGFFERSGAEIKNDHIQILKETLNEIVKNDKENKLRSFCEYCDIKTLLDVEPVAKRLDDRSSDVGSELNVKESSSVLGIFTSPKKEESFIKQNDSYNDIYKL